jgi:hypothetical protein
MRGGRFGAETRATYQPPALAAPNQAIPGPAGPCSLLSTDHPHRWLHPQPLVLAGVPATRVEQTVLLAGYQRAESAYPFPSGRSLPSVNPLCSRGDMQQPTPWNTDLHTSNMCSSYKKRPPVASGIWRISALDRCPIFCHAERPALVQPVPFLLISQLDPEPGYLTRPARRISYRTARSKGVSVSIGI